VHISKEFKVGILAIVSIVILYLGFNFLKGIDFFSSTNTYYAFYKDIDGLTVSNPVIINGLTVGRIDDISIRQDLGNKVLVELSVDSDIMINRGSEARLVNLDFMGSKAIEVILLSSGTSYYEPEDTLASTVKRGISELLSQNAEPMTDELSQTISTLNEILLNFKGNSLVINATLENILKITEELSNDLPEMGDKATILMDNLNKNSEELSEAMGELKPILQKAGQFTDSLSTVEINTAFKTLQSNLTNLNTSLERLNRGEGTMGKMMNDDSLYIYLSHTARDLDRLLVDLQANPQRYVQVSVFGKKDKTQKKKKNDAKEE
jgi:phospholipid/cholesterol/gamma-HCH transport system substrate-binding protein